MTTIGVRHLAVVAALVALAPRARAQDPWHPDRRAIASSLDSAAREAFAAQRLPGMTVIVVHAGDTLLARGYGYADLENEVPAAVNTVYGLGGLSTQFTAVAVMQLVESRGVGLDDDVSSYVPGYATGGGRVTVRQLIANSGGVRDLRDVPGLHFEVDLPRDSILSALATQPLDFSPGSRRRFSTGGYFLLGALAERVTRAPFGDIVDARLAGPLRLQDTRVCDPAAIIRRRARGYVRVMTRRGLANAPPASITQTFASLGICSTAPELLRWQDALAGGRVLARATYDRMVADQKSGGLLAAALSTRRVVWQDGTGDGFSAWLGRAPADSVDVVVLTNVEGVDVGATARALIRTALGLEDPEHPRDVPIPSSVAARVQGSFAQGRTRVRIYGQREQSALWMQVGSGRPSRLMYQGNGAFRPADAPQTRVTFEFVGDSLRRVRLADEERTTFLGDRVAEVVATRPPAGQPGQPGGSQPPPEQPQDIILPVADVPRFVGTYGGGLLRIRVIDQGGKLAIETPGNRATQLLYQGGVLFLYQTDPATRVTFEPATGTAQSLTVQKGGRVLMRARRVP